MSQSGNIVEGVAAGSMVALDIVLGVMWGHVRMYTAKMGIVAWTRFKQGFFACMVLTFSRPSSGVDHLQTFHDALYILTVP